MRTTAALVDWVRSPWLCNRAPSPLDVPTRTRWNQLLVGHARETSEGLGAIVTNRSQSPSTRYMHAKLKDDQFESSTLFPHCTRKWFIRENWGHVFHEPLPVIPSQPVSPLPARKYRFAQWSRKGSLKSWGNGARRRMTFQTNEKEGWDFQS